MPLKVAPEQVNWKPKQKAESLNGAAVGPGQKSMRVRGPGGKVYRIVVPNWATDDDAKGFVADHVIGKAGRGRVAAAVGGFADTPTFGLANKLGAAMRTVVPGSDAYQSGFTHGFGNAYDNNLKTATALTQYDERNHPNYRLGGQVAGAFVPVPGGQLVGGTKAGRAIMGASKALKAKPFGTLGVEALKGAAGGAAYGFNTSTGSFDERMREAGKGALFGGGGGAAGAIIGKGGSKLFGGKKVSPNVRKLIDSGVVLTRGQRGGAAAKTFEEGLLGSIPFVKNIPAAAKARGIDQLNIAAINEGPLAPLGKSLSMNTQPGNATLQGVHDTVYQAYDDALNNLSLQGDDELLNAISDIQSNAMANVGQSGVPQLDAKISQHTGDLFNGPVSGDRLREVLSGIRGDASGLMREQPTMGKQMWGLHDQLTEALMRQNPADATQALGKSREAVAMLKRIQSAAAKPNSIDGVFSPTGLMQSVSKKGFGTTDASLANGSARLFDLANAAKAVMPNTIPNSGTPERLLAAGGLSGGLGMVDPTIGGLTAASLLQYAPGVDRLLQNFAVNRPDFMKRFGRSLDNYTPALAAAGYGGGLSLLDQ